MAADPPNPPIASALHELLSEVPLGVGAALTIVLPRVGATLQTAVLFVVLGDHIRIQPEFVPLAILAATARGLSGPPRRRVAREIPQRDWLPGLARPFLDGMRVRHPSSDPGRALYFALARTRKVA